MLTAESKYVGLALTFLVLLLTIGFTIETFGSDAPLIQQIAFYIAGAALAYGAFVHVLCHYGYACRLKARELEIADAYGGDGKKVSFGALIPSYREEPEFVYRALLSVALQRTEHKWLRLLIDDPPDPQTAEHEQLLNAARALPSRVTDFVKPLRDIVIQAEVQAEGTRSQAPRLLARAHRRLAAHFSNLAHAWPNIEADDRFFRDRILLTLADNHAADALTVPNDPDKAREEIASLMARFYCDVSVFERKVYENVSHVSNKAMNLNTGLEMIGKRVVKVGPNGESHLKESDIGEFLFPPADFVITLDADSLISPDYAETLLAIAVSPGAEKIAVFQTPYSTMPEPASLVERIAGATTDVQRLTHQGFQYFESAFWVGANAVLRVRALRDIAVEGQERGHSIRRYIQDRTPIEDTESTIDLALEGWQVYNHDAVLAWSATPKDFGSLTIQRRRWACGGLIVLPKAIRASLKTGETWRSAVPKFLIRAHYLGSLMWIPMALIVLLLVPFDDTIVGIFLPLVAVPYFVAYGLDLVLSGRPLRQIVPVYCLNLLLIPINLSGAIASLRQAITRRKVGFVRTPKVANRTSAPVGILFAVWSGGLLLLLSAGFDAWLGNTKHALFAMVNGMGLLIAGVLFVGIKASFEDITIGLGIHHGRHVPHTTGLQID